MNWSYQIFHAQRKGENIFMLDSILNMIKEVEYLNNNTPDGQIVDADTLLVDAIGENGLEITGIAQELFDIYLESTDKNTVKKMFFLFTGIEFDNYLVKCRNEITKG